MEQHNDVGTIKELVEYRLETARNDLHSAEILLDSKAYKAANNRAYYAIYHAINSVHAIDGNAYKRHKDALAQFNKKYVKEDIFPREIGKRIAQASEIRHASDYDDFYLASVEETREQIDTAREIIELISKYCKERLS